MVQLEEVLIDVRDVDQEWFRDVRAYLDRGHDRYHLPRESAERLGEIDPDTGDAWLIDGHVEAKADEIEMDGQRIPCWSVGCAQMIVRPASTQSHRGGTGR